MQALSQPFQLTAQRPHLLRSRYFYGMAQARRPQLVYFLGQIPDRFVDPVGKEKKQGQCRECQHVQLKQERVDQCIGFPGIFRQQHIHRCLQPLPYGLALAADKEQSLIQLVLKRFATDCCRRFQGLIGGQ